MRWLAVMIWLVPMAVRGQIAAHSDFVRSCLYEHGQPESICRALSPPRSPLLQQCWAAAGESRWQCVTITQRVEAVQKHQEALPMIVRDMDQRYPAIAARDARHCAATAQAVVCVITQRPRQHRWFYGLPAQPSAPAAGHLEPGSEVETVWYSARHDRLVVRASRNGSGELVVYRPDSNDGLSLEREVRVLCPKGLRPDAGSRVMAHPDAAPAAMACNMV